MEKEREEKLKKEQEGKKTGLPVIDTPSKVIKNQSLGTVFQGVIGSWRGTTTSSR